MTRLDPAMSRGRGITLREATLADVPAIASIHVAGWKKTYRGILPAVFLDSLTVEERSARWAEWMDEPESHTLLALRGRDAVGFARLSRPRPIAACPENCAEVTHLYVASPERGRGTGRELLARATDLAREAGRDLLLLWVLEENRRARSFYERFGLRADGARHTDREFFGNDAAEVRYRMELRSERET